MMKRLLLVAGKAALPCLFCWFKDTGQIEEAQAETGRSAELNHVKPQMPAFYFN